MERLKDIIDRFPEELKGPLYLYFDYLREEFEIKRKEFEELKEIVKELVIAQQKTEERVNQLTERVNQLTIAQQKTEERVNQLTERVNQLAIAQQKTEERVNQLVIAQQKTEEEIRRLTMEVGDIKKQLGGLSHSVGYELENRAYKALPNLLKERYDIEVKGRILRKYVEYPDGREDEINIFGKGKKNGKEIYIIGEVKTNLTKNDIEKFKKKLTKIEKVIIGEKFPLFVVHTIHPKVEKFAEENGFAVFISYDF